VLIRSLALCVSAISCAAASPHASFQGENLVIRDGHRRFTLPSIVDSHAEFSTIHSVQRRGTDYFVVYGTSEWSRGWPPRNGKCGCGLETYIRWLQIRDRKIIADQEGRYISCLSNRDGWGIDWKDGKLMWRSEGLISKEESGELISTWLKYSWVFDPSKPEAGITESQEPTK